MSLEDLQKQMNSERKPRELAPDDPFAAYSAQAAEPTKKIPAPIMGQPLPAAAPVAPPPPPRATYSTYPPAAPAQPVYAPAPPPAAYAPPSSYRQRTQPNPKERRAGRPIVAASSKTKPILISVALGVVFMLAAAFSFLPAGWWGGVSGKGDRSFISLPQIVVTDEGDGNVGITNNTMEPVMVQYIIINAGQDYPINELLPAREQHNYSTHFPGMIDFVRVQTSIGVRAGPPDFKPEIKKQEKGTGKGLFDFN